MKNRCAYEGSINFEYYGGRGITVCPEWRESFKEFRDWALSHGYADDLTIDRIDNDGNYEPSNCLGDYETATSQQKIQQNSLRRF
jgi:hypothetical protein